MFNGGDYAGANSNLIRRPSAAAAPANVVKVRLVSFASSKRFRDARLVLIFLAIAVFVIF